MHVQSEEVRLRIVAMGMSSCLGPLVTACAAFRAGITRHRASLHIATFASGDGEPQPINVCEIPSVTLGFEGVGRLVAVTLDALQDLGTHTSLEALSRESGLFLAIPDFSVSGAPTEARDATTARLGRQILGRSLAGLGLSWPEDRWRFFAGGSAGFSLALAAAHRAVACRAFDTVIVGGIDSLVDPSHMQSLLVEGRLKTADNPVGLIPGEAGALLVLRARETLSGRKVAAPAVEITGIHSSFETCSQSPNQLPDGSALAACVQAVLRTTPDNDVAFICDLTGEQRRAWEWGSALVRLRSHLGARLEETRAWVPATSFGCVGAASGAVGACLAARAFARHYAPGRCIIVVSQSDSGHRAAFALSARAPLRSAGAA